MVNAVPVGHYSRLGEQTIQNIMNDDAEYIRFLKYFGRVFKHPVTVALEFYVNRPDAQFIASENQWKNANYHLIQGCSGIQFLDQKGNTTTLYDFDDVSEEIPPKRWTVTQKNVEHIRSELQLDKNKPLFVALDESASSTMDDLSLIQELGFSNLSNADKLKFRDSYHNMIQIMITGRLEINGARYNLQPDKSALELCQTNEQRLLVLTNASSAARKALASVEYAFDTLRTHNNLIRKEKEENELRKLEGTQSGTEISNTPPGLSSDSKRAVEERNYRNIRGNSEWTDRMDVNAVNSEQNTRTEMVSRSENENHFSWRSNDSSTISVQSDEWTVQSSDSERTLSGGRTDRNIREDVDELYGEELSGEDRVDVDETQLSDSGEVGESESGRILGAVEQTVRQESEESSTNGELRENSGMGTGEETNYRPFSNDGNNTATDYNSIIKQWENLDIIINTNFENFEWVYFNSDSDAGGQIMVLTLSYKQIEEAIHSDNPIAYIHSAAYTQFVDITDESFLDTSEHYLSQSISAGFTSNDADGEEKDEAILEYFRDFLEHNNNIQEYSNVYDKYRSDLPDTKYTALTAQQDFNYRFHSYVNEPETSIWGNIDHCYRINNGIFEVCTSSHGGVMIKSDIARTVLSGAAQNVAQKENGWFYFEEDCDFAVAKRELLDKGLFYNVSNYFKNEYNKNIDTFFLEYTHALDDSIKRWNSKYWESREKAIFNSKSPEEQAAELGQMPFSDSNTLVDTSINDNTEETNTFEIYQLKDTENLRDYRFENYNHLVDSGKKVSADNYEKKYNDILSTNTSLDDIYYRFNMERPYDFEGHSLSVSDIIVTNENGKSTAYYVDSYGFKKVPEFLNEQKPDIVADFREKTASLFNKVDGYSAADIEDMVYEDIQNILSEKEIAAEIGRVILSGSRCRGLETINSDIDVVVEIQSELKEDVLFNILNEEYETEIGGFKVDINPIRKEQSGTLENYLPAVEKYLSEKSTKQEEIPTDNFINRTNVEKPVSEQTRLVYAVLSRCKQDCEFVLLTQDNDSYEKLNNNLYGGSINACIDTMREHLEMLKDNDKPEWLTESDVDYYEAELKRVYETIGETDDDVDTNIISPTIAASTTTDNETITTDYEDEIFEHNAATINDTDVGDLLKIQENDEYMYFRVENISGDFMISMERVNKDGSNYADTGLATKSIVGNWKEILAKENENNPIVRYPKSEKLVSSADTNNIDSETRIRPHKKPTRAERLYKKFTEAFPDIANGNHSFERYGKKYNEYGENDAFEPLSIENMGDNTYSFMFWYVQNGDLMRDPDYVFTLDHEKHELHVMEYQIDGIAPVGTIYQNVVSYDDNTIDLKLQSTLENSFESTLKETINFKDSRPLTEYHTADGKTVVTDNEEPEIKVENADIDDKSIFYRETLNAFSEKHNLGELNIEANDSGFQITEKYSDGESSTLWHIQQYKPDKPLSVEELEKELLSFEKAAENNSTYVNEYGYRLDRIEEHGGTTELPPVQEKLADIVYADNPLGKVRDNVTAIKELHRLEECERNNKPLFDDYRNGYNSYEASMDRLRKYSGWGGVPQAFDERYSSYNYQRKELKELLTPEEYEAARASTLNSHYTPQNIIDSMYKTIQNMGISENSRILEPACGTGNFINRMPQSIGKGGIVGVELDPITARIAIQLSKPYTNANDKIEIEPRNIEIINKGFEYSGLENNSFDLVIGNVPFGDYKMNDPDYTKDWLIHDAFFRKALDKVAPGGVVAFITSSGTMDKKNPKVREHLATNAELIGAVRLPNNAFSDAGTSVTSDIIFLQKRKEPLKPFERKPDWCYTTPVEVNMIGKKYEGELRTAHINSYFVNNPQMVLGTMKQTTHYDTLTCEPFTDKLLKEQLDKAFRQLNAKISIEKREKSNLEKKGQIEPWGKSFTYQVKDGKVYYNYGDSMEEITGGKKSIERLMALCELRDIVRELLDKQHTEHLDVNLIPLRNKLNESYDEFVKKYGNLSGRTIKNTFGKDADYPILSALETINPKTEKIEKADIFTRRTVNPIMEVNSAKSAEEAMQISLDKKGRLDISYMAVLLQEQYGDMELTDIMDSVASELLEKELIYRDPEKFIINKPYSDIVDKSDYLCGNVRRKLTMAEDAAKYDSSYEKNVTALKEVIPEDIGATEISVDLGCTWIDTADYENFMRELSGRNDYASRKFNINHSEETGKFTIEGSHARNIDAFNTNEISTYGTEDMNMYHILENLLNQKRVQVYDYFVDPITQKKKSVLNKNKTQVANSKAKEIKKKFNEWIFATEERKEKYVNRYNEMFNNLVGRSYDGSHLTFSGMANDFKLRPHQLDCVARTIYGGNTLAAHCVGAGKSAVIAASVMKKKELGLINKACVVVPKSLTEQTEREWRNTFPDAKLLVVDSNDLSNEKKRELFTARVATGNYDAVIMSREQFEKLPMSDEYKLNYLREFRAEKLDLLISRRRESGRKDPGIKEIEATIKNADEQIQAILNPKSKTKGKDTLIDFEKLGFDYLVVDEAHAYKNGSVSTKMGDVSGISTKQSGRSADMKMKCDYYNEEFGNGHILFATGTPVSNSMTELYVMTRYLRPDVLKGCGCSKFDDWAATFGNIKTQNKKTATGELKLKTCFAGFKNRPELMKMYKEFADLKTLEHLDYLNPPKVKGGKPQIIEVEATPEQREIVKDFAKRGKAIQSGKVTPSEDNLLKITGEARIVGLGNRAVASVYEKNDWELPVGFFMDDKTGKIDKCIENVVNIYRNRKESNGVQIIFSDIAVNSDNGNFSAYEYIKDELIKKGIPENEIVFAPKSDSKERADIFRDINEARYRVVIASTETLGTGANIQKNLYALHHLDIPWRPSDFQQREGRIIRQGNLNDEVEIFNYVTKGTLDSYLYQGVTDKARGIAQLWNDTCISRTAEDIDEKVLTFGELEAAAEGNPKLREYSELKNRIDELQVTRAEYNRNTTQIEKNMKELPSKIEATKYLVKQSVRDLEAAKSMITNGKIEEIKLICNNGNALSKRSHINKYLSDMIDERISFPHGERKPFRIGNFNISVESTTDIKRLAFVIKGERSAAYRIDAGVGIAADNCQRLMNFLESGIEKQIQKDNQAIEKYTMNLQQSEERIKTPFPYEKEYEETLKTFDELEKELTLGGFLDNGEEFASVEDFLDYETEKIDFNKIDENDMTPDEYNTLT